MNTSIDQLLQKFEDHTNEEEEKSEKNPEDAIFDFSLSQQQRIDSLNTYYKTNPNDIIEIISKLNSIYCMSTIGLLRRFISEVSMYSNLPIDLRIECAITLADIESSQSLGLDCLKKLRVVPDFGELPAPYRLELILKLVNSDWIPIDAVYDFIHEEILPVEYRYRTVLLLENNVKTDGFKIMIEACKQFSTHEKNEVAFRILACQNILSRKSEIEDDDYIIFTETLLIEYMCDENLHHHNRADAADVILHFGSNEVIHSAEEILRTLGGKDAASIYENKENVHTQSIEFSVMQTIQYLDTCNLSPIPTFNTVSYNILRMANEKDVEQIKTALLRIELDKTVFSIVNHTLQSVLLHLYAYIQSHQYRSEMQKRLIEELVDMAGTCSSGYVSRLVNVLSGFDDHSLTISWEDQIAGNLAGRLNARMKEDENMENILEQMVNKDIADRSAFLAFFRKHISDIKEEMYEEFRQHMEDSDWDLYFRKALINYEK